MRNQSRYLLLITFLLAAYYLVLGIYLHNLATLAGKQCFMSKKPDRCRRFGQPVKVMV